MSLGEFQLINTFVSCFPPADVPVGIGDDCAILSVRARTWCVTTDALVENVHFSRPLFSWADIGHKALAVNLSDLAAMGATPAWFVCALGLPVQIRSSQIRSMALGMAALARQFSIQLVGGNITRSTQVTLTRTATGTLPSVSRSLTRSGASPNDRVYVSGTLGGAAAGLQGYNSSRQRRPQPQIRLGQLALDYGSAAIDVSDGFAQDLSHLCRSSQVGARIEVDRLPLDRALGGAEPHTALNWAIAGGEDYELIVTVPEKRAAAFERACARQGQPVSAVGKITRGKSVKLESLRFGRIEPTPGFDHFKN